MNALGRLAARFSVPLFLYRSPVTYAAVFAILVLPLPWRILSACFLVLSSLPFVCYSYSRRPHS
jgi:hypothetical protein